MDEENNIFDAHFCSTDNGMIHPLGDMSLLVDPNSNGNVLDVSQLGLVDDGISPETPTPNEIVVNTVDSSPMDHSISNTTNTSSTTTTTTTTTSNSVVVGCSSSHLDSVPVGSGDKERLCKHCLQRIEDMRASQGTVYRDGASLCEENWAKAGTHCFGLCESSLVCVEHGYPLHECFRRHCVSKTKETEETLVKHTACVYRARWVLQKRHELQKVTDPVPDQPTLERKFGIVDSGNNSNINGVYNSSPVLALSSSDGSPSAPQSSSPFGNSVDGNSLSPSGDSVSELRQRTIAHALRGEELVFPCDCFNRLVLLAAAPWVTSHPDNAVLLRRYIVESITTCTGFCKTPYCCRIHMCPADQTPGHGTRYQCQRGSHDNSDNRGRHHADFCYYCGDPDCCGGRWYSRDQAHKRAKDAAAKDKKKAKSIKDENDDDDDDDSEIGTEMKEVRKRPEKRRRNATESSAMSVAHSVEDDNDCSDYEENDGGNSAIVVDVATDETAYTPQSSRLIGLSSLSKMSSNLFSSEQDLEQKQGCLYSFFRCINHKVTLWTGMLLFFVLFLICAIIASTKDCDDDGDGGDDD